MKARAFVAIFVLGLHSTLSSANESMSYASHLQPSVQHMGSTQYHGNLLAQRPEVEGVTQHKPEGDTTRIDTESAQDKEDAATEPSGRGDTATGSMMGRGGMHGMHGHKGSGKGGHHRMHGGQAGGVHGRGMKHDGGGMHGKHGGKRHDFHQQVLDRLDRIEKRQILIETMLRELLLGR